MREGGFLSRFARYARRSECSEIMDDPLSDERMLVRTLKQFDSVNTLFSGRNSLLSRHIVGEAKKKGLSNVAIVECGAGGGDWTAQCLRLCEGKNIGARVTCVDRDKRAVKFLRNRFTGEPSVKVVLADLFDPGIWNDGADFLFGNHVLHHLSDTHVTELLRLCRAHARCGFFFNDLERSAANALFFSVSAGMIFRRSFIVRDGVTSIARGFTREELAGFADGAGLGGECRISRSGPGHFCISWQRRGPRA